MIPLTLAALTTAIAVAAVAIRIRSRFLFWLEHSRHMQESGYLVPPPSLTARLTYRLVTRAIVYLGVGPIKVTGRSHLRKPGRKIFVPNHQFNLDFAVASVATRTACPVMTKSAELKSPLLAFFGAWTGAAIPVNIKEGRGGQKSFASSCHHLERRYDSEFLIFPQGALFDDLKLSDFKPGAARMQKDVSDATFGEPVWLIPMYIEYRRDADSKPVSQLVFGKLRSLFGRVNYGVDVHIGDPIAYNPARSIDGTTAIIHSRIALLRADANSLSRRAR